LSFPSTFICLILFRHISTCMVIICKREDQKEDTVVHFLHCGHNYKNNNNNQIQIFKNFSSSFIESFKKINF
jgi:hypothetical protein